MALGLETRRDYVIGLFVPQVPGTDVLTVVWPQGLRRCQHIRILKLEMGHRCQSSGLSPSYEHTPKGSETEIETGDPSIMRPLTHIQVLSASGLLLRPSQIRTQDGLVSWASLVCPRRPLTLGQGLLTPQLTVAMAFAGHRLPGQPPASLHRWLHLAVPLAGPACLPAFQLSEFCPFSHSSPALVHQRPQKLSCSQSSWPCLLIIISRSPAGLQKGPVGRG